MDGKYSVEHVLLATLLILFVVAGVIMLIRLAINSVGKSLGSVTRYYTLPPYLSWIAVTFWSVLVASWGYKELVRIFTHGAYQQSTIAMVAAVALSVGLCGLATGMKSWVMLVGGLAGGTMTFCISYIYTIQTLDILI